MKSCILEDWRKLTDKKQDYANNIIQKYIYIIPVNGNVLMTMHQGLSWLSSRKLCTYYYNGCVRGRFVKNTNYYF